MKHTSFQTLHAPFGSDASFALGLPGHGGGFQTSIERIIEQDVFIGIRDGQQIRCFPYYKEAVTSGIDAFVRVDLQEDRHQLSIYDPLSIRRTLEPGHDRFEVDGLSFELFSTVGCIPEPHETNFRDAVLPAVTARMTIDNRNGQHPIEGIFGISVVRGLMQLSTRTQGHLMGFSSCEGYGFAVSGAEGIEEFIDFNLTGAYNRPKKALVWVADMPALSFAVPAGTERVIDIALGWYREGNVLHGTKRGVFYHTSLFSNLEEVLAHALGTASDKRERAHANSLEKIAPDLSVERRDLLSQAIHSYYASTMLFESDGKPLYVVNEGSYRMMSTLDLLVDHAFLETRLHPWTLRNQLDTFLHEYSYTDQCGLSFSHDFGTHRVFASAGNSSYEVPELDGCFSYMTQEQVCNWVLSAAIYADGTDDKEWVSNHNDSILQLLRSMEFRDNLDGSPTGLMNIDSNRCVSGAEITTYDSLDPSLGQARRNLYLAVKCWATYLALSRLLDMAYEPEAAHEARDRARITAETIVTFRNDQLGFLPAILEPGNVAPIIPAIEGLIYPLILNMPELREMTGPHAQLVSALRQHALTVLKPDVCLFPDSGWKLSANSDNSWISKIFLCEYVSETLLSLPLDYAAHDRAHAGWWFAGCASNPGIDQIFAGTQIERGFHYPRGVSCILWLPAMSGEN